MVRNKASLAQTRKPHKDPFLFIVNRDDPWKQRLENDPRFASIESPHFMFGPVIMKEEDGTMGPKWVSFVTELGEKINSIESVHPSKWKVIVSAPHGGADGKIVFDMNGGKDPLAPDWGLAKQMFPAFYEVGVRRLHFQTCLIGRHLLELKYCKKTREMTDSELMNVTAWNCSITAYDDDAIGQVLVDSDDYVFRGLPGRSAMQEGKRRSFNAIIQVYVGPEGQLLRRVKCSKYD